MVYWANEKIIDKSMYILFNNEEIRFKKSKANSRFIFKVTSYNFGFLKQTAERVNLGAWLNHSSDKKYSL